jgi:ABC-type antimicrobial peptide transport system permease subunit
VDGAAAGSFVPWRDTGNWPRYQFAAEGYTPAQGEDYPYARQRFVAPGFFSVLGVQVLAGRAFTDDDRREAEPVVMVSQSVAQRLFPDGDALNRQLWSAEAAKPVRRRIVGVVADVDDENVVRTAAMTIYFPVRQAGMANRLFVRTSGDPYALVPPVTRIIRELSADQAVERAATLADVRAEVLTPERLNAFVVTGFAVIALLIAVVGVAGVLAFSVSARTREFGVRMAVGSTPLHLLAGVVGEGAAIVAVGIAAGGLGGYAFAALAARFLDGLRPPGVVPMLAAATVLGCAAVLASLLPAARASRVDVVQALRTE